MMEKSRNCQTPVKPYLMIKLQQIKLFFILKIALEPTLKHVLFKPILFQFAHKCAWLISEYYVKGKHVVVKINGGTVKINGYRALLTECFSIRFNFHLKNRLICENG